LVQCGFYPLSDDLLALLHRSSGELFQISLNQSWGSEDPGMSWAYGLVYDGRVAALDFLWEDGEMETIAVIQGTFLAMRTGVHEMVLVRPLDTNGDLVK